MSYVYNIYMYISIYIVHYIYYYNIYKRTDILCYLLISIASLKYVFTKLKMYLCFLNYNRMYKINYIDTIMAHDMFSTYNLSIYIIINYRHLV